MSKIPLLILAAGLSSRMKSSDSDDKISKSVISQANTRSKGFIEIQSGNPLIYYIIKNAMAAGISCYYIILSKNSDEFKSYLDKISQELKIQIKIAIPRIANLILYLHYILLVHNNLDEYPQ